MVGVFGFKPNENLSVLVGVLRALLTQFFLTAGRFFIAIFLLLVIMFSQAFAVYVDVIVTSKIRPAISSRAGR